MVLLQNLDYSEEKLPRVIPRPFLSVSAAPFFKKFADNQPHSRKKSIFRNCELQARELWPRIISQMKEGINIGNSKSSEPI